MEDILKDVWPEWHVVKVIGRGSFGVVYEAVRKNHELESHAAIKVISIPQNESEIDTLRSEGLTNDATKTYLQDVVSDFVSEIRLMESFKGVQNIVSVEDYEVVEKKDSIGWDIYIRMELLTPFNSYICDKTLSEQDVIKLGIDICTALELCAKRNVIHRDIKPENIFINQFGDFKLGDFGIARKLENVTGGLSQKGTYNYMAPEIEKGTMYDATVDLYSLGLVLYRFRNKNKLPFLDTEKTLLNPNERVAAIRRRMDGEPLPTPCEASPAMAEVILKACAFEPQNRFQSATEMKRALIDVGNGTYKLQTNDESKTVSLRNKNKTSESNETVSVRKAKAEPAKSAPQKKTQQQQKPKQKSRDGVDTFGKKKKSHAPLIIGIFLVLMALIGGGTLFGLSMLEDESVASTSIITENDGTQTDTAVQDKEKIQEALDKAAKAADSENYDSALATIQSALITYPESEELLSKETEYKLLIANNEADSQTSNNDTGETISGSGTGIIAANDFSQKSLITACPPYESSGYEARNFMDLAGKSYTNGFRLSREGFALFNLEGKYSSLDFDLGHLDGTDMGSAKVQFMLDGINDQLIELNAEDLPKHYTIDLTGVKQMKITIDAYWPEYGFANVILTPNKSVSQEDTDTGKGIQSKDLLLTKCPPYESSGYEARNIMNMAGKTYSNGFRLSREGYALFNLDGSYTSLNFDLGHLDQTDLGNAKIQIMLDGVNDQLIEAKAEDLPKHYTIDLTGVKQMKITIDTYWPEYGFANVVLK